MNKYTLEGREIKPCHDLMEWASWYEAADRHVGNDTIGSHRVSTIFLGIDCSFGGEGPLLLFETMVFPEGNWSELYCQRYSTYDEAEAGHKAIVQALREGKELPNA